MIERTDRDLVKLLARKCEDKGAQAAFSRKCGVSTALVSLTLSGKKPVGKAIARALGYQRKNVWSPLQNKSKGA